MVQWSHREYISWPKKSFGFSFPLRVSSPKSSTLLTTIIHSLKPSRTPIFDRQTFPTFDHLMLINKIIINFINQQPQSIYLYRFVDVKTCHLNLFLVQVFRVVSFIPKKYSNNGFEIRFCSIRRKPSTT